MHRTVIARARPCRGRRDRGHDCDRGGSVEPGSPALTELASSEAQKRCPKVQWPRSSVASSVCLRAGQAVQVDARPAVPPLRLSLPQRPPRATRPTPPPVFSRKIDVGGFRLEISCRGAGSPTVVLESGAGWGDGAWYRLQPKLATTTRVCSYDRAGLEGQRRSPPAGPGTGREGRRGAAHAVDEGRHLPALRPRRLVPGRLLQSLVREAVPGRGGRSGRRGRDADRASGRGPWLNPPASPPSISSGGRGFPTPTTWRVPERSSQPRRLWERVRSSF